VPGRETKVPGTFVSLLWKKGKKYEIRKEGRISE